MKALTSGTILGGGCGSLEGGDGAVRSGFDFTSMSKEGTDLGSKGTGSIVTLGSMLRSFFVTEG